MALRVWLPLNGDLENKGISDYEVRSANITIVDDGKIGKCYSFNGSNSYINITNFEIGNNWSYGCWVNTPNSDSRGWEIVMILNNSGSDADSQFAFWVHQKENRFESLANTQYVSTIPYTNYYNSWHHFFATFNGSLLTTYIDGNIVNTKTITAEYYPAINLTIGARSNNTTGTAFTSWFQGYLNDIRVYDHCLSQKEVKEISQGLVLHYKLNGFSGGVGDNLIEDSDLINKSTLKNANRSNCNSVTSVTQTQDGLHLITPSTGNQNNGIIFTYNAADTQLGLTYGDTITYSVDLKGTSDSNNPKIQIISNYITNSAWWYGTGNSTTTYYIQNLSTEWKRYSVTKTLPTDNIGDYFIVGFSINGNYESDLYIRNIKVEVGSIATPWTPSLSEMGINTTRIVDSSGYGNYSYPYGIYFISEQGPRYNVMADFSGAGSSSSAELSTSKGNTIAFWCSASNWSEYSLAGGICQGSNWSITSYNNNLILELVSHISAENSNYNLSQTYSWTLMPTSSLGADWHYFI